MEYADRFEDWKRSGEDKRGFKGEEIGAKIESTTEELVTLNS